MMGTDLNILMRQVEDLAFKEAEVLRRAIALGLPHEDILELTGRGPVTELKCLKDLDGYKSTGLTPDQIREMDVLYSEKCREVASLERQLEMAAVERDKYRGKYADALRAIKSMKRVVVAAEAGGTCIQEADDERR